MRGPVAWWRSLEARPRSRADGRLTDVFAIATLAGIPLATVVRPMLPYRFSADGLTIQLIARGRYTLVQDPSYAVVSRLYAALGLVGSPLLASALGLAFGAWALWGALRGARGRLTFPMVALVAMYTVLLSIYLAQFSKDIWAVPVIAIALFASRSIAGEVLVIAAIVGYALTFRTYWFLVLLIYVMLRLATWRRLDSRRVLVAIVAVVVGATVLAPLVLGQEMQSFREINNLGRATAVDSNTLIVPAQLGGNPVADSAENLLTLASLVLPAPLAALGSPLYLFYSLAIAFAWFVFARATFWGRGHLFDGSRPRPGEGTPRWALLLMAYVVTQGFFEPDYGSYLRHLTPFLPLMLATALHVPESPFLRPVKDEEGTGRLVRPWPPPQRTTSGS